MEGETECTQMTPLKGPPGRDDSGFFSAAGRTPSSPGQTPQNGPSAVRKRLEFEDSPESNGVRREEEEHYPLEQGGPPTGSRAGPCSNWWDSVKRLWREAVILILSILLAISLIIQCLPVDRLSECQRLAASPPPCPKDWIGINGACYFFSNETKTWEKSQEFCKSHNGSLAIILNPNTLDTIRHYKTIEDPWVGLRKRDNDWWWNNDIRFSSLLLPLAQGDASLHCAYLNNNKYGVLDCTSRRNWICTLNTSISII